MACTATVVVVDVLLRIMAHDPIRSSLAEYVRVPSDFVPVCVVEHFSVVEAHFLSARYALETAEAIF